MKLLQVYIMIALPDFDAMECENNSIFIGRTHDLENRWNQHLT
jgi:GIY-YIG catalytic domain.